MVTLNAKRKYTLGAEKEDEEKYSPFDSREVQHPTSDFETFIHLVKGSLGSGILAMPMAFLNGGLWFSLIGTIVIGFIVTYGVHILVKSAHKLCYRMKIPKMTYAETAENSFRIGSQNLQRWAWIMRLMVNTFLSLNLLGCCCIYLVFVGRNVKQIMDYHKILIISVRLWILIFTVPLIFMCLVRNLKNLVPFSFIANICMFVGIIITCTFIFSGFPGNTEHVAVNDISKWPLFFGTVLFALEAIGVVMTLENEMKNPEHFIGCPSVLNFGMGVVTVLYTFIGFFGYWKYGSETQSSITLSVPVENGWAQAVKVLIAIAIFLTFTLQFYVPFSIIWGGLKDKFLVERQLTYEYLLRIALVIMCGGIAAAFPDLGPFISLIGAFCLSVLGLIIPAIIELAVYRDDPGYGRFKWRIIKNAALIIFGLIGLLTGSYVSILEFRIIE